jgi:hypothetical protein
MTGQAAGIGPCMGLSPCCRFGSRIRTGVGLCWRETNRCTAVANSGTLGLCLSSLKGRS